MCVVSMISGHYQQQFPIPNNFPPQIYPDYSELIRKARLYDELMKQKDCPDPAKEAWQKQVEKIMWEKYGLAPKWVEPK